MNQFITSLSLGDNGWNHFDAVAPLNTFIFDRPAVAGRLLVFVILHETFYTPAVPADWTQIISNVGDGNRQRMWVKIADGTEDRIFLSAPSFVALQAGVIEIELGEGGGGLDGFGGVMEAVFTHDLANQNDYPTPAVNAITTGGANIRLDCVWGAPPAAAATWPNNSSDPAWKEQILWGNAAFTLTGGLWTKEISNPGAGQPVPGELWSAAEDLGYCSFGMGVLLKARAGGWLVGEIGLG